MGIIRNHLNQMKQENESEYQRLLEGYKSEEEFIADVLGLTGKALAHYDHMREGGKNNNGSAGLNQRSV